MKILQVNFLELPPTFIHQPPENCSYEVSYFKRNVVSIWLLNHSTFTYTDRTPINTIWGFYNTKTEQYQSPINSTKQGNPVDIDRTTPYSAMVRNYNPLESVLYG